MIDNIKYEENNYPKAIAISVAIMVGFVVLSFFIIVGSSTPLEEIGTGGIVVNYGTAEMGMGSDYMSVDEPSVDPNANNVAPDKVVPNTDPTEKPSAETSDKSIVTQDVADAPSVATNDKKTSDNPSTTPETKKSQPTINPNALYKGKKNNSSGLGDGTGTTPGNQGSTNGDPLSPDYGEGGSGNGNMRLSLANRRFVNLPRIEDSGQSSGRIAVEIRVDKSGTVIYARAGAKGTTLSDLALWRKCETAVLGASLNQLEAAPDIQVGVVMFNFKVK